MDVKFPTLESWLDEPEGYAIRRERVPPDAMVWIEAAWHLGFWAGAAKGREIELISNQFREPE